MQGATQGKPSRWPEGWALCSGVAEMLRLALTLAKMLVAQTLRHMAATAGLWALALVFFLVA